jgi:hypothetical protein
MMKTTIEMAAYTAVAVEIYGNPTRYPAEDKRPTIQDVAFTWLLGGHFDTTNWDLIASKLDDAMKKHPVLKGVYDKALKDVYDESCGTSA